jgi:hypothetical protein
MMRVPLRSVILAPSQRLTAAWKVACAIGPAVGYGPHRTIHLTGIDANGTMNKTRIVKLRENTE